MPNDPTPGPLVGRGDELALLSALAGLAGPAEPAEPAGRAARGEQATAVLLAGDAGVGKTRLLTALAAAARDAGQRVLVGHCLDVGHGALPYLPFREALDALAAEAPPLASSLVEASPALARLAPRAAAPRGAVPADGPEVHGDGDTRVDRSHLFEAVHRALGRLADDRPLLLVLEDLHWADESTRALLGFLLRRQVPGPVTVVGSYRTDDLHRRHPLRRDAGEWGRLPGVHRLALDPLPDDDVRTLVRSLVPASLPESRVRGIVRRAEGNAFFTEELVAATSASGDARGSGEDGAALPTDLADLLLVRLDRLDDRARQVVRAVAVAGRRVPHALLAQVSDVPGAALDEALRAAVEQHVLVAAGHDAYAFRHALLAEAVYDDLLPGERTGLHAAYAAALTSATDGGLVDGVAAELARHARAAHDLPTAFRASVRAGDEAMAVGGPTEAAAHFEQALALVDAQGGTGPGGEPVDVVDLTVRTSEATSAAGHVDRAIDLVQAALRDLPDDAAPEQRARLLLPLAEAGLWTDLPVDVLAASTEAVALVPEEPPSALRARVLTVHARATADRHRGDEAARWAEEAVAVAELVGLPSVAADARTTLAKLRERAGDPEAALRGLARTVTEARAAGDVGTELRGLFTTAGLHYGVGRLPEARAAYEEAVDRARESGRTWGPFGLDARMMTGLTRYVEGDWDGALRVVDTTGEDPPAFAEAALATVALAVHAGRGDPAGAALLPGVRPWWDRDGMLAVLTAGAALDLHGDRGDLAAAEAVYEDVVACVGTLWQQPWFQARLRFCGLLLGQLAAAVARSTAAEREELARRGDVLAEAARTTAEEGLAHGLPRGPESEAWLARVEAEHRRLRWLTGVDAPDGDALVAAWREAVDGFTRLGHVFETARSRARLAAVLRATGEAREATAEAEAARAVARELGAEPLLAELRALGGGEGPGGREARAEDVLTAREREVLALVAEGRSNPEIGRLLYISTKTVSVHVSHVLAKLGASGRTEAVAVARRRGLLPDPPVPDRS